MWMGSQASCPSWSWAAESRVSRRIYTNISCFENSSAGSATWQASPPPTNRRHAWQCGSCYCQVMSLMSKLSVMLLLLISGEPEKTWRLCNWQNKHSNMTWCIQATVSYILLPALEKRVQLFLFPQICNIPKFALLARQLCKMNQVKSSKIKRPGVAEMMTYVLFESLDLI